MQHNDYFSLRLPQERYQEYFHPHESIVKKIAVAYRCFCSLIAAKKTVTYITLGAVYKNTSEEELITKAMWVCRSVVPIIVPPNATTVANDREHAAMRPSKSRTAPPHLNSVPTLKQKCDNQAKGFFLKVRLGQKTAQCEQPESQYCRRYLAHRLALSFMRRILKGIGKKGGGLYFCPSSIPSSSNSSGGNFFIYSCSTSHRPCLTVTRPSSGSSVDCV